MSYKVKQFLIQQFLPDKLFLFLKGYGWYGDFRSWQEAEAASVGYDAENILQQVKTSLLKVKNGDAVYERDSVIFDTIQYSWELLAALMWIAAQNKGQLHLIDFGGSLGSTYYQNKIFLDYLDDVSWNIVEQDKFVDVGREIFQDDTLRFYTSISEYCLKRRGEINTILFSSVLQYLEAPFDVLKEAFDSQIKYIVVDRTGFTLNDKERITIQKVPVRIYKASYPCRFFSEAEFVDFFEQNNYRLISDFVAHDQANVPSIWKGFIFMKNN
jgi:putative methyltransferase (TIGR04325 family)